MPHSKSMPAGAAVGFAHEREAIVGGSLVRPGPGSLAFLAHGSRLHGRTHGMAGVRVITSLVLTNMSPEVPDNLD